MMTLSTHVRVRFNIPCVQLIADSYLFCVAVPSLPALGPWAPQAERGPSLESIYRVSLTVDLCEG